MAAKGQHFLILFSQKRIFKWPPKVNIFLLKIFKMIANFQKCSQKTFFSRILEGFFQDFLTIFFSK